jgi:RNA polymerase sigma-70 factor (ECF subfamily)
LINSFEPENYYCEMELKSVQAADEDSGLVALCKKGDPEAFEKLVDKYQRRIFNTVLRIVGNSDDAADATQDAFLSAYRAMSEFEGRSSFSTWLHAIAINSARNRLRQSNARRRYEVASLNGHRRDDDPPAAEPASKEATAPERLEKNEVRCWCSGI